MPSAAALKRSVQREFRLSGLTVRPEAVHALESVLRREENAKESLRIIMDAIKARSKAGQPVDRDLVREVVRELSQEDAEMEQSNLEVVDAFDMPKFRWNTTRRVFYEAPAEVSAKAHIAALQDRLTVIKQRLLRNPSFAPPVAGVAVLGSQATPDRQSGETGPQQRRRHRVQADARHPGGNSDGSHIQLTQIESLAASAGTESCVLGMLTRNSNGRLCLEDANGKVELDVSDASTGAGLLTEGSIVLVEGELRDGVLVADNIMSPPMEERQASMAAHGNLDFVRGGDPHSESALESMVRLEAAREDAAFVIVSEVHLDDPTVLANLRRMLQTYEELDDEDLPTLFALMGNFCSLPFGEGDGQCGAKGYKTLMRTLGGLLAEAPRLLSHATFVIIPGPRDPVANAGSLPQHALPTFFSRELLEAMATSVDGQPRVRFGTNPCRVMYLTQEIVLFREEMLRKMRRFCVRKPDESQRPMVEHQARTFLQQAHLCPLPVHARPILHAYDHALRLYPAPTTLVVAETSAQAVTKYEGTTVLNPGSFALDSSFVFYSPSSKSAQFSRVQDVIPDVDEVQGEGDNAMEQDA
ncbi:DNA polymerase epsilon subunit B [Hondaea fermentalgiana]|uniref:DNA polymerase epsilon subunit n=1 Tax=Hondaea fermentalgiana TaxID=2315210 RepID=A0A2R5G9R6_9STRA|nr:DNA polymerase epsilon subunit B [Hondaea fermentalgiana]|eukprot:GBG26478.1 DNA polymerase epsilon subunit B [Hondaea fermentalgiana]